METAINRCWINVSFDLESPLQEKQGLWAIVYSYHGRGSVIESGTAGNVKLAVEKALNDYAQEISINQDGKVLVATKYGETDKSHSKEKFDRELSRKFNIDEN